MTSFAATPGASLPVSSNRIDSGTASGVNPQYTSAAYSVAPTPHASAPDAPPMHVCESVACTKSPGLAPWRKAIFMFMAHNASSPVEDFSLPEERTVLMGSQVDF